MLFRMLIFINICRTELYEVLNFKKRFGPCAEMNKIMSVYLFTVRVGGEKSKEESKVVSLDVKENGVLHSHRKWKR